MMTFALITSNNSASRMAPRTLFPQSRQSAKLFLQRRNWNSPTPLGAGGCAQGGRARTDFSLAWLEAA